MSAFGRPYLLLAFYKVFWIIFTYLGAYFFVKRLISFVEFTSEEERASKPLAEGYLYALGIFLTCVGSSVCIQQVMAECTRIGVQVRLNVDVVALLVAFIFPTSLISISVFRPLSSLIGSCWTHGANLSQIAQATVRSRQHWQHHQPDLKRLQPRRRVFCQLSLSLEFSFGDFGQVLKGALILELNGTGIRLLC
jgi:hypothetical protein